jgi:hypothetical protein
MFFLIFPTQRFIKSKVRICQTLKLETLNKFHVRFVKCPIPCFPNIELICVHERLKNYTQSGSSNINIAREFVMRKILPCELFLGLRNLCKPIGIADKMACEVSLEPVVESIVGWRKSIGSNVTTLC